MDPHPMREEDRWGRRMGDDDMRSVLRHDCGEGEPAGEELAREGEPVGEGKSVGTRSE